MLLLAKSTCVCNGSSSSSSTTIIVIPLHPWYRVDLQHYYVHAHFGIRELVCPPTPYLLLMTVVRAL